MVTFIIVGAVAAVVGFVVGVLVGRANSKTVTAAITDVKAAVADVKAEVLKLTGSKTAATTSSSVTGSK
jgi:hypothetical protein